MNYKYQFVIEHQIIINYHEISIMYRVTNYTS